MEGGAPDIQHRHSRFADLDAGRVGVRVPVTTDPQSRPGRGGADQVDDGGAAVQGFAAPVLADEGKAFVLYPVPFAGPGRQVTHAGLDAELLQFDLPQPDPAPVGAAAVGGDAQLSGLGVARLAQAGPTTAGCSQPQLRMYRH